MARASSRSHEPTSHELVEAAARAGIGIALITDETESTFVYVSSAAADLLGQAPDDLVGRRVQDFLLQDAAAQNFFLRSSRMADRDQPRVALFFFALGDGERTTETARVRERHFVQAERLASLGSLAGGIAHELNNPLSFVLLNLEWMTRELDGISAVSPKLPAVIGALAEVKQGAERVSRMVRDLRAFARADIETESEVNLKNAIELAISMMAHELKHRARVVVHVDESLAVWANKAQVEQIFLNLLMSLVRTLPEDREKNSVSLRAWRADHLAMIEISDNGESSFPDSVNAGLSISRRMVTSLNGDLALRREPGKGRVFQLTLSAIPSEEAPETTRDRARVLVIDDDAKVGAALCDLLRLDHDATAVSSVKEAEAQLAQHTYDVIFCDLMMPEQDGIDLYAWVEVHYPALAQKVIFMTGGAFTDRSRRFLDSIKNPRIEKPFTLRSLESAIGRVCRKA